MRRPAQGARRPHRPRAARRDPRNRAPQCSTPRRVGSASSSPGRSSSADAPRRDRPRRRRPSQPDERRVVHGDAAADAADRRRRGLRALETGRWVAQVAPTGFTAFIDDHRPRAAAHRDQRAEGDPGRRAHPRGRHDLRAHRRPTRRRARAAAHRDRAHRGPSSSITVTGPSLTSSTAIVVRNRPVATRAPS